MKRNRRGTGPEAVPYRVPERDGGSFTRLVEDAISDYLEGRDDANAAWRPLAEDPAFRLLTRDRRPDDPGGH